MKSRRSPIFWAILLFFLSLSHLWLCHGEDLVQKDKKAPKSGADQGVCMREDESGSWMLQYRHQRGQPSQSIPIPDKVMSLPKAKREVEIKKIVDKQRQVMEEKQLRHPADRRPRELIVLRKFFKAVKGTEILKTKGRWLSTEHDHCTWFGVTCGGQEGTPDNAVTKLQLPASDLQGSLPSELGVLEYLVHLSFWNNELDGSIPENYATMSHLRVIDVSHNYLTGRLPTNWQTTALAELRLSSNFFAGPVPTSLFSMTNLSYLDISHNLFTGTIPKQLGSLTNMSFLLMGENCLEGSLPSNFSKMTELRHFDAGTNVLTGKLPSQLKRLTRLWDFNVADNLLSGTFPSDLMELPNLQTIMLSENLFRGWIPPGDDLIPGRKTSRKAFGKKWSTVKELGVVRLNNNNFTGTIAPEFLVAIKSSLGVLDLNNNRLKGTIPSELGQLSKLHTINLMSNHIRGTIPNEMLHMNPNLRFNFTDNLLTGTIPGMFCGEGAATLNMLYREFGCDAVLCRPGTFNNHGHATLHSACRKCPPTEEGEKKNPPVSKILGRVSCPGRHIIHGDLNGDGVLSPREILRMIYVDTLGRFWGAAFQPWADMKINECELAGITCVKGKIVKIDLTNANMCSNGDRKPGPIAYCKGLPPEIGQLSSLEILQATRRQFLRGTLPTEVGQLSLLKFLDLSSSAMSGTLPSELGLLKNLKTLVVSHARFEGTVPYELFNLPMLEKLHLSNNNFSGSLPRNMTLESVKEFMISRNAFSGRIPTQVGLLSSLENFEAYGNFFTGRIPSEMAHCSNLRRVDLFNNLLNGTLPDEIGKIENLQIFHIKENRLTGTIPVRIGELTWLSWIDLSMNRLHGTIPSSFGTSRNLKDLRIADNMIYDPIPRSLCTNTNINGGVTKQYGCDGIVCGLGSYSSSGFAEDGKGCTKCPTGKSTLYLGSTSCQTFTTEDILSMFFEVMQGSLWADEHKKNWQDPNVDVCKWSGVTCDDKGEMIGLGFPLIGSEEGTY